MGMGQKDVADFPHLIEREVADTCAGIDQHLVVDEDGGSSQPCANTSAAAQYLDPHPLIPLSLAPEKKKFMVSQRLGPARIQFTTSNQAHQYAIIQGHNKSIS